MRPSDASRLESSPEPWRLAGYQVGEFLGRGGFGEVWRGQVKSTRREVALKRLPAADAAERKAARVEAAIISSLDHPNLVRLHELRQAQGRLVLVMDYAARGSLNDLLARRGRLSAGEVVYLISAAGSALSYAHNVGIVHSHVTPGNILFNSLGITVLGDLGLARVVDEFAPTAATAAYIDPVVARGVPPSKPSDVFMLAATATHALTGQPLWRGSTADALTAAQGAGESCLRNRLADIAPEIAAVLLRGLASNPSRRPTMAEFALDLRAACVPTPVNWEAGRVGVPNGGRRAVLGGGAHRLTARLPAAEERSVSPVPLGRWRRVLATVRYRPRDVAKSCVVLAVFLGAAVWCAQTTTPPRAALAERPPTSQSLVTTTAITPTAVSDIGGDALTRLRRVDARREQAYADRQPAALAEVYAPGPLLSEDVAMMQRLVPPGCGLVGVHTDYADAQATATSEGLSIIANASMPASQLRCPQVAPRVIGGRPATRLRITLTRHGTDYRISGQQAA